MFGPTNILMGQQINTGVGQVLRLFFFSEDVVKNEKCFDVSNVEERMTKVSAGHVLRSRLQNAQNRTLALANIGNVERKKNLRICKKKS